jgi:PKD repeat protein
MGPSISLRLLALVCLISGCAPPHFSVDTQAIDGSPADSPVDTSPDAATAKKHLVVFAGQSNNGLGPSQETSLLTTALPSDYDTPFMPATLAMQAAASPSNPIVWMGPYATQAMQPYTAANGSDQFGSEFAAARYLEASAPSQFVYAKFAISSSSLAQHWKYNSTYPTSPSGGPNLFSQLVAYCQAQEIALNAAMTTLVWIQGETDAQNASYASAYGSNLTDFWTAFQATYPNVTLIFVKLNAAAGLTYTSTVRAGQDSFQSTATHSVELNVDSIPLGTGIHYTADHLVSLGRMIGGQILASQGINVLPTALFHDSISGTTVTFADASTDDDGTVVAWSWDFGDGNTSTAENPVHAYSSGGPYTVSLTVTDSGGGTSQIFTRDVLPTWTVDSSSGIGTPVNATEWTATSTVSPADLWTDQESSGNAIDKIGSHNAVVSGAASWTYLDSVTGFTRNFLTVADNTTARFLYSSAPSASSHSLAYLAYVYVPAVPSAERSLMSYGGLDVRITTGGFIKVVNNSAGTNVIGQVSIVGHVLPILLVHDITNGHHLVYTPSERISLTYAASTANTLSWGEGGDHSAHASYTFEALTLDTEAERTDAQVRAELTTLGWDVTW